MEAIDNVRVFITNYGGHPGYAQATQFGEFKYVTKGYVSFQEIDKVKDIVAQGLSDSTAEDYLLISGINIIATFAALLWFRKHKKIRLLIWDMKKKRYRENEVTEFNLDNLLEANHGA